MIIYSLRHSAFISNSAVPQNGGSVESERVQLKLLPDCVNIDGDTKGLPESLLGNGDNDHPNLWLLEI